MLSAWTVIVVYGLERLSARMAIVGDESDLRERMRQGMSCAVRRLGGARRVSGTSLVALLCASALAPVVAAGVVVGPVLLAGLGVVGAVGAGALTDVITDVADRLRRDGKEVSQASVENDLALKLEEALASQGDSASALREAVAALLRGVDAMAAVEEASAARDQNLMLVVAEGFAGLDEQFSEFAPVIEDVRRALWDLQESARQQEADRRVERERAREDSLTLLQVREMLQHWGVSASEPADMGVTDPIWSGCPYLGLVPFEERDARVFYGRSELVRQLVQRLLERLDGGGILLVVGASGAGKSSLLRAGLMHSLAAGALGPGSEKWPRRVICPTDSPMRELARHLADVADLEPVGVYNSLLAAPDETPLLVHRAVRVATGPGPDATDNGTAMLHPRLVLVVDQFEELFHSGDDSDAFRNEREAFVRALRAAAAVPAGPLGVPGALVVVAVRGDFLDRTIAYAPLAAAVQASPFAVGPMSEAELRDAITGPAAEAGLDANPDLVETVISELRERANGGLGSGALPLMSQAMAATWELRDGNELTLRVYRRAGGIADAVNRSAQAAYEGLSSRQQDVARLVFTQLIVITAEGQLARRRCSKADLYSLGAGSADIDAILNSFSAQRLLVLGEQDSVEIAHDVLLHVWKQLRDWLDGDKLDRALYSQVITDADWWQTHHRDPSYLYRPGRLATVNAAITRWQNAATSYPALPATGVAFLEAATAQARRGRRRWLGVAAVVTALVVAAGVAVSLARHYDNSAGEEHAIALSRQLAAASLKVDATDPVTARQLALAAWSAYPTSQAISAVADDLTEQITNGYLPADSAGSGITGILASSGGVTAVAFSPDGRLLATGGADVRLWNPVTGQPVGTPLHTPGTGVAGLTFSSDGKLLAAADTSGDVQLWHVTTRQPAGPPLQASPAPGAAQAPTAPLVDGTSGQQVAFSADGTLVASGGSDGYARVWDVATGRPAGPAIAVDPYAATRPVSTRYGVNAVAFSPAGRLLATAAADGYVRLWDPATGTAVGRPMLTAAAPGLGGPDAHALAFSPDGKTLATAGIAVGVQLWSTASHVQVGKLLGVPHRDPAGGPPVFAASCWGLAFSPDGRQLACAESFGGPELIDIATGQPTALYPPVVLQGQGGYGANAVAFSPVGGGLLASGNSNGTATLWDIATQSVIGAPLSSYPVHAATVRGFGLASGGQLLDGPDSDGYAHLVASLAPSGAGRDVLGLGGVAFSPDGLLAAVPAGRYLQLADARTGKIRLRLLVAGPYDTVTSALFSPDGSMVASVDLQGTVRLWSTATGAAIGAPMSVSAADVGVFGEQPAMAFSPDGRLLALASADGYVGLISTATGLLDGASLPVDPMPRAAPASAGSGPPPPQPLSQGNRINTVAFSPDGSRLAVAGADGYIRVWDVSTRRPADGPIPAAVGVGVRSIAFSPAGTILASVAGDGSARLWNPTSGSAVGLPLSMDTGTLVTNPVLVSFSPDGSLMAVVNSAGYAAAWPEWLAADPHRALCEQVGPPPSYVWSKYAPGEPEPDMCP